MTIIRTDDIDDLLPSEYQEPWPPLQTKKSKNENGRRNGRTISFHPTPPNATPTSSDVITRQDCDRSINQLLCLILGAKSPEHQTTWGTTPQNALSSASSSSSKRWSKLSVLPIQKPCRRVSTTVNVSSQSPISQDPQPTHSRGRMVMYHYKPVQEYECKKIQHALDILKGVIAREDSVIRWMNT